MTSWVNPSKRVTEILSQFLEFDPQQLTLGIWNGDLTLENVKLKQQATTSLLSQFKIASPLSCLNQEQHLRLVQGHIGHLHMKIPWKGLIVWGRTKRATGKNNSNTVILEISNVDLKLELCSTTSGCDNVSNTNNDTPDKKNDNQATPATADTIEARREQKQAWLREAERLQLQGLSIPETFRTISQSQEKQDQDKKDTSESADAPKTGRLTQWMERLTSAIVWNIFAGLEATIRNVRVVMIQEGVEIGLLLHSFDVSTPDHEEATALAPTPEMNSTPNHIANSSPSAPATTTATTVASRFSHTTDSSSSFVDDDEHSDFSNSAEQGLLLEKRADVNGMALFIRQCQEKVDCPETLKFSLSVEADDYVVRPTQSTVNFSFFLPHPPGTAPPKKQNKRDDHAPKTDPFSVRSIQSVGSYESSLGDPEKKRRRGKREKNIEQEQKDVHSLSSESTDFMAEQIRRRSNPTLSRPLNNGWDGNISSPTVLYPKDPLVPDLSQVVKTKQRRHRSLQGGVVRGPLFSEGVSVASSPDIHRLLHKGTSPGANTDEVQRKRPKSPHLDFKVSFDDVKTVCSTKHYNLALLFVSTMTRIQNGRPGKRILDVLDDDLNATTQSVVVDVLETPPAPSRPMLQRSSHSEKSEASIYYSASDLAPIVPTLPPPDTLPRMPPRTPRTRYHTDQSITPRRSMYLSLHLHSSQQSEKRRVIKSWWEYAYTNVRHEVQRRRQKQAQFSGCSSFSFDWTRQKYRRKEYVELYISTRLDNRSSPRRLFESQNDHLPQETAEEVLRKIEDELAIEQILLYRAIARALRVRGLTEMPDSMLTLQRRDGRSSRRRMMDALVGTSSRKKVVWSRARRSISSVSGKGNPSVSAASGTTESSNLVELKRKCIEAREQRKGYKDDRTSDEAQVANVFDNESNKTPGRKQLFKEAGTRQRGHSRHVKFGSRRKESMGASSTDATKAAGSNIGHNNGHSSESKSVPLKFSDHETYKSFKSAKTSTSSKSECSTENTDKEGVPKFSFGFKLSSFELLVFRDDAFLKQFRDGDDFSSTVSRQSPANVQIKPNLALVASSLSDESLSDISVPSEEEQYFESGANEPRPEEEETGPILSSTDFLNFGLPSGIILDLSISPISIFYKGYSGGAKKVTLEIGCIHAEGEDSCRLVTIGTPRLEELEESQETTFTGLNTYPFVRKRRRTLTRSSIRPCAVAAKASLVQLESGKRYLELDVASIDFAVELEALGKFQEYISATAFTLPRSLLEKTELDKVREFIIQQSVLPRPSLLDSLTCALRFHDFEVSCRTGNGAGDSEEELRVDRPIQTLKASVGLIEYYTGSLVDHIFSASSKDSESRGSVSRRSVALSKSRITNDTVSIGWAEKTNFSRSLKLLDINDLVENRASPSSSSSVLKVSEVRWYFDHQTLRKQETPNLHLLKFPLDVEVLITRSTEEVSKKYFRQNEMDVAVSACEILLSKRRLELISELRRFVNSHSLARAEHDVVAQLEVPPRMECVAAQKLLSANVACENFRISVMHDEVEQSELTVEQKEIVMEDAIAQYLSVTSCFDLKFPSKGPLHVALEICCHRLMALGLTSKEAHQCAENARLQFLRDIDLLKTSQTQTMYELSSKQLPLADNTFLHSTNTPEEEIVFESEDASVLTSADSSLEENSQESVDIIETALRNSVEQTIASFLPLLGLTSDDSDASMLLTILTVETSSGLHLNFSKYFYDHHLAIRIPCFYIQDASGIRMGEFGALDDNNSKAQNMTIDDGIVYSSFGLDKRYEFASGGAAEELLCSNTPLKISQQREILHDITFGEMRILFCEKLWSRVFESLVDVINAARTGNERGGHVEPVENSVSSQVSVRRVSLLMTSNEMNPFSQLTLDKFVAQHFPDPAKGEANLEILSNDITISNLTPEGQHHPNFLQSSDNLTAQNRTEMRRLKIQYFESKSTWKSASLLELAFQSVHVIFLRQYFNELLQFCISPDHGLGRFMTKWLAPGSYDDHGNPPPPLHYRITLHDSTVFLPRSSMAVDMVAIDAKSLEIFNSIHRQSFSLPTVESGLEKADAINFMNPEGEKHASGRIFTQLSSSTFPSDSEFFDCESVNPSRVTSRFENAFIRRTNVRIHDFRIFVTVCPKKMPAVLSEGVHLLRFFDLNEKPKGGKPVFVVKEEVLDGTENSRIYHNISDRLWDEISCNLTSLEVLADYAPDLRLLITDDVDGVPQSLSLHARMSQLYLLLSVWYSNMQELPVMFPYALDEMMKSATFRSPPSDFPEYGSISFVECLKDLSKVKSEIACVFKSLVVTCKFDKPGYFSKDPASHIHLSQEMNAGDAAALQIRMRDATIHVTSDSDGIMRVACGANVFELQDLRKESRYGQVLQARGRGVDVERSWADLQWGLRENDCSLNHNLGVPFQLSVFMTPGWCLVNLGLDTPSVILIDFTPIWILLDYFSLYFSDAVYGNPSFEAESHKEKMKDRLLEQAKLEGVPTKKPGINIDFRLWLIQPILVIPSEDSSSASVAITSKTGFWYKYQSIGTFSSQELGSTNLSMRFNRDYLSPREIRCDHDLKRNSKILVSALSFGLRIDHNALANHTEYVLKIPFFEEREQSSYCGIASDQITAPPILLPPPMVCMPLKPQSRLLGSSVSEITLFVEVLPLTMQLILRFLLGSDDAKGSNDDTKTDEDPSFNASALISGVRFFLLDPVLGMHLPIAVLSLPSMRLSASQLGLESKNCHARRKEAPPSDLQILIDAKFWADYFKQGVTRSWEPLIEPFSVLVLYEKSLRRGQGLSLQSEVPFHLNLTGAFLLALEDTVDSLSRAITESFRREGETARNDRSKGKPNCETEEYSYQVDQAMELSHHRHLHLHHNLPISPTRSDRVAFSLLNLTGQRMRVHQLSINRNGPNKMMGHVTYLNHNDKTQLFLEATISVVRNMKLVAVPFPGLPQSELDGAGYNTNGHGLDIQIAGFRWLQDFSVDTSGRKFDDLVSRDTLVHQKTTSDWRLRNTMKVLTEVGYENGGRLITMRSLFEVRNQTSHSLFLRFHPDATHTPGVLEENPTENPIGEDILITPGADVQIPLLLLESAMKLDGNHLGSIWVRPEPVHENKALYETLMIGDGVNPAEKVVGFSSRPVQLAKVVYESAVLLQRGGGVDLPPEKVKTGLQISCPISEGAHGIPLAPFCYAIEIRRSPVVRRRDVEAEGTEKRVHFSRGKQKNQAQGASSAKKRTKQRGGERKNIEHLPVSYSLVIHPPIVVDNLLPVAGRFELMHATRETVLWFADLKPGEKMPVHAVGLDAPLLLLVNLGFCRTPVGEGALVHHGSDEAKAVSPFQVNQNGLKNFGKVVTKGTKQIGKTLTSISDSPENRGRDKILNKANPTRASTPILAGSEPRDIFGVENVLNGTDASKRNVHVVDGRVYNADEIATETVVVDSVGQRLVLGIENIRGGGGNRKITLFCPFWIINTTEHALRYRQDKSSTYVAGTVSSANMDGSKAVDSSKRNDYRRGGLSRKFSRRNRQRRLSLRDPSKGKQRNIFGGTVGALGNHPGRCSVSPDRLTQLIQKDLPLSSLAELAFMFNFQDDGILLGQQRLSVQLADGTGKSNYASEWSQGFSVDTVGVQQVLGMHCRDGRVLELSVTISVAPGILSTYTKVVRFTPRFILVNRLPHTIRVWQDSSLIHSIFDDRAKHEETGREGNHWHFRRSDDPSDGINQYEMLFGRAAVIEEAPEDALGTGTTANKSALYITSAEQNSLIPFHLPDTRKERQLRIDIGGNWNISSSFPDTPGEHTLKLTRASDLRMTKHVNTRASPHYKVVLPPRDGLDWDGELGVWFETSWGGERKIVVKGIKRDRFSFNYTDIHVGDELLRIDDINVSQLTFAETMKELKERLARVSAPKNDYASKESTSFRRTRFTRKLRRSGFGDSETARLVLTFRTLEESLRRVRVKASRKKRKSSTLQRSLNAAPNAGDVGSRDVGSPETKGDLSVENPSEILHKYLKIELRALHSSIFLVVQEQNPSNPPYRIENRALNHFIFFRQRGCTGFPWNVLKPGATSEYCWEEPMKSHKLTVRVGSINIYMHGEESQDELQSACNEMDDDSSDGEHERRIRRANLQQLLSFHRVDSEEHAGFGAPSTIKLEEIGFVWQLPCPKRREANGTSKRGENFLSCRVDSDGATRLLVISDNKASSGERSVMQRQIFTLQRFIREEQNRIRAMSTLSQAFEYYSSNVKHVSCGEEKVEDVREDGLAQHTNHTDSLSLSLDRDRVSHIENEAIAMADFAEDATICRRNQLVIEVIEASGLQPSDIAGHCNPYCEVVLINRSRADSAFFATSSGKSRRKTYFMEKTLAPKWIDQNFVFDVPAEAADVIRGHTIQVRVRSFRRIGQHPYLGQTNVHLRSLRNQKELVGWYPLVGKTGTGRDLEDSQANWGRGSVRLRVQWVYTVPALIDYFLMLSERRLHQLERSVSGMKRQLEHVVQDEEAKEKLKDHEKTPSFLLHPPFGVTTKLFPDNSFRRRGLEKRGSGLSAKIGNENQLKRLETWSVREPMKSSRDKLMWLFHFQTAESRRSRRHLKSPTHQAGLLARPPALLGRDRLESISELSQFGSTDGASVSPMVGSHRGTRMDQLDGIQNDMTEVGLQAQEQILAIPQLQTGEARSSRRRSLSLDDLHNEIGDEALRFGRRARALSRDQVFAVGEIDTAALFAGATADKILVSNTEEERKRAKEVSELTRVGLLHPYEGGLFHRDHLTYHFRRSLLSGFFDEPTRIKSLQRVSESSRYLKSWLIAQAVLNDADLSVSLRGANLKFSTPPRPRACAKRVTLRLFESEQEQTCEQFVTQKFQIPDNAPKSFQSKACVRGSELYLARNNFERACKRSLRAVLNPGGWLTVRPITALNLPDMYTGMSVKLHYESVIKSSQTVDAKVVPLWTVEGEEVVTNDSTSFRRLTTNSSSKHDKFKNDLSIPVEPQKTSGSLRISVVGERLNSKVEVGVLDIPLGAAISCCVECMENSLEQHTNEDQIPMYIRWFPLMNPKDCGRTAGDMGYNTRPSETEKESDTMFSQYFSPCVKLALIWRPHENDLMSLEEESIDIGKEDRFQKPTTERDENDKSKSPLTDLYFNADIGRISTALIDSQRALELLALSISDIDIRYSVSKVRTRIGFVVGGIQIDHQVQGTREPVVLAPTPVLHPDPTLQFWAFKDNLRSKGKITSYDFIACYLGELDIIVEEAWFFDIWEFLVSIVRRREVKRRSRGAQTQKSPSVTLDFTRSQFGATDSDSTNRSDLLELLQQEDNSGTKTYIEKLILGAVRLNLSYFKGRQRPTKATHDKLLFDAVDGLNALEILALNSRDRLDAVKYNKQSEVLLQWSEYTHDEDLWQESGDVKKSINVPNLIAAVLPSVSGAPVRLPGKRISHVFESLPDIFNSIKSYYNTETLKQIYKIIGSLDFVGNPTMVLNSFATGVRDFFIAPSKEFLQSKNPSRVGLGVAKGTLSLLSHSTSGLFGFASKMTATVGQAAATLSFDPHYQQWHREMIISEAKSLDHQWKRRGIPRLSSILTRPIFDIVRGFALGASGLIVSPIVGAKEHGAVGFAKGVAIGTVGIFAKPVVGIFDAFAHLTGSIHDVAKSVNVLERRFEPPKKFRLPYTFGLRNVLMPFNPVSAQSVALLGKYPVSKKLAKSGGSMAQPEVLVTSEVLQMEPGVETMIMVTNLRIILIKVKKGNSDSPLSSLCWEVQLVGKSEVSSQVQEHGHNGVALTITTCIPAMEHTVTAATGISTESRTPRYSATSIDASLVSLGAETNFRPPANQRQSNLIWDEGSRDENPANEGIVGNNFYRASEKQGQDVVEWFTVLAEFNHRRQLSRVHNAICCVTGDFEGIIRDRGLSKDGSEEGYTIFGEFYFGDNDAVIPEYTSSVVLDLEDMPWVPENFFWDNRHLETVSRSEKFIEQRRRWTLERELESSSQTGGPHWLVMARSKAEFVPEPPPDFPSFVVQNAYVHSILTSLDRGEISLENVTDFISQQILNHENPITPDKGNEIESEDTNEEDASIYSAEQSMAMDQSQEVAASISLDDDASGAQPEVCTDEAKPDPETSEDQMQEPLHMIEENAAPSYNSLVSDILPDEIESSSELLKEKKEESRDRSRSSGSIASDTFHSVDGRSSGGREVQGNRLEKVESMLEKLLALSLQQAEHTMRTPQVASDHQNQSLSVASAPPLGLHEKHGEPIEDSRLAEMQQEITELRAQLESQAEDRRRISGLQKEIADLKMYFGDKNSGVQKSPSRHLGRKTRKKIGKKLKSIFSKKKPSDRPLSAPAPVANDFHIRDASEYGMSDDETQRKYPPGSIINSSGVSLLSDDMGRT